MFCPIAFRGIRNKIRNKNLFPAYKFLIIQKYSDDKGIKKESI
jgi:hypothetical protein